MSTTIVLSATEDLIDAVVNNLDCTTRDLSQQAVVFPGKRPAHFLRKRLGIHLGGSYQPPLIFAIDEFIDIIAARSTSTPCKKLTPLDAASLLYDIHERAEYALGNRAFRTFSQFLPIGIKLFHEFEELVLAAVEPKTFRALTESLPYGRMQAMGRYYEEFVHRLHQMNYTTRAWNYKRVASTIEHTLPQYHILILAGFHALTPVEQQIFDHLKNYEQVLFIFQRPSTHEGTSYSNKFLDPLPPITLTRAPDIHGQMFALARILQDRSEQLDETSVVVLPNPQSLFPFLHSVIPSLPSIEYNVALGYPLVRTPLVGFLHRLLTLGATMENHVCSATHYIRFLLHPYVKNIRYGTRTDITRILVHTLEEHFVTNPAWNTFTLEQLENAHDLFTNLAERLKSLNSDISADHLNEHLKIIHDNTIRKVLRIQDRCTIGSLAESLLDVLTFIHDSSTAKLHPFFNNYIDTLVDELETLSHSLAAHRTFPSADDYVKFLRNYLENCTVPFTGTPLRGLQVLGLLETRTLRFRTVYLIDANEGILPPAPEPFLIPTNIRTKLGLQTQKQREELIEHYLRLLLQSAEEVHIFFSETPKGKRERSRYISTLLWNIEEQKGKLCENEIIRNVQYNIHLVNSQPSAIGKTPRIIEQLKRIVFSATMLDTYLRCQLRFYYRYILGLYEYETVTEDLEERDIGIVVHRTLQNMFEPFIDTTLSIATLEQIDINRILASTLDELWGPFHRGRRTAIHLQIQKQLQAFLTYHQVPLVKNNQVLLLGVERTYSFAHNDTFFTAKLDRIERRNNQIYILDYKTSANETYTKIDFKKLVETDRSTWRDAIGSFQLPVYTMLYATLLSIPHEHISPAYIFLGKTILDETCEVPLYESREQAQVWQPKLESIIHNLIEEMRTSEIPFTPPDDFTEQCRWCPYQSLCGTQWVKKYGKDF